MTVLLATLGAALVAAPAWGAPVIRLPAGGTDAGWSVVPTSSGTYVLTTAYAKKHPEAPVARLVKVSAAGVTPAAALPVRVSYDVVAAPAEDGSAPCIGSTIKSSPYVACLQGDAWVERRFTGAARTRTLLGIRRYGPSLYAFLLDGDLGVFDGKHPERFKLHASIARWDGTAWAPVASDYVLSIAATWRGAVCGALAEPLCTPLLEGSTAKSDRITLRKLGPAGWVADGRSFAQRKSDVVVGRTTALGDRLALPVFAGTSLTSLDVLTDSVAPKRIRVATVVGTYVSAWLGSVAGVSWVSWTDYFYFDKKETRGLVVGRAAPLDLVAGAAGPATEVYATRFRDVPPGLSIEEVDGLPYAAYSQVGKTQDTVILSPLAAP